jgi:XTP/dITP diphosphohydrolase
MNIILSTRNPSKAEQIKAIFAGSPISILTLSDAGIEGEAVEDGTTLQENALKKAVFAHQSGKVWAMADDTGLFIDHLDGVPGVRAARWAGETATTEEITWHTLKQLKGAADRSATFETVVAIVSPEGKQHFFSGKVRGQILEAPRTPPQPKMPYSPIFVPEGTDLVWAEMSVDFENSISHRGKAFRQAREFLESLH